MCRLIAKMRPFRVELWLIGLILLKRGKKRVLHLYFTFTHFLHFRNPNKNEDRQEKFELVHWDSYDNHQKYLELGKLFTTSGLRAGFENI